MGEIKIKAGGKTISLTGSNLEKLLDPGLLPVILEMTGSEILACWDRPLSELAAGKDSISTEFTASREAKWKPVPDGTITCGCSAGAGGTLTVRKNGEMFHYFRGENEQEKVSIRIPPGYGCVSTGFRVTLAVTGGGAFSHGPFGVQAGLSANDLFNVINHRCFPLTTRAGEAVEESFRRFVLPFDPAGIRQLQAGDYLEYEFIGKLGLGFGATWGIGGLLFGGRSFSELKQSFEAPLGKLTAGIKPSFKAGAGFAVDYAHTGAFRVVTGRGKDKISLYLFKLDRKTVSTTFNAGISVSAKATFSHQLQLDRIIDEAAARLTRNLPAAARKAAIKAFKENLGKLEHKRQLDKYVREANQQIAALLKQGDNRKTELELRLERIKSHSALFVFEFDPARPEAMEDGYRLALAGDFIQAIHIPGVDLLPGSCIEEMAVRRTTVTLALFGLFSVQSLTEYFQKSSLVYAGQGVFKWRYTTGIKYESGHAGHGRHAEVFFTADASTSDFTKLQDTGVLLHIVLMDHANGKAARQTAGLLQALEPGGRLEEYTGLLEQLIEHDKSLTVKVAAVFHPGAMKRLSATEYEEGKPPRLERMGEDRKNWEEFVRAVDTIREHEFPGQGFPDLVQNFQAWAEYNVRANDRQGSRRPPDRHCPGNTASPESVWPAAWSHLAPPLRRLMVVYLEAGRSFMNLCDHLRHLAGDLEIIGTDRDYRCMLDCLNAMIREDVAIWFTKPALLALVRLTGGKIVNIQGPAPGEAPENVEVSFDITD